CLTCGKFGHYKEGCPERGKATVDQHEGGEHVKGNGRKAQEPAGANVDGPWRVVQKQRKGKKAVPTHNNAAVEGRKNGGPAKLIAESIISGS
ncbi:hypothetical protein A2U01_0079284, partial [Trifolium medium]|nr:hypothetical protein [Trifolium medium]